jgi:CO/xanthine dehydrogenase FAD-binding subunit
MPLWKHYYTPTTVADALAKLAQHAGQARVIAGGTDLLIDMQHVEQGRHPLEALVDVTAIPEMTHIVEQDGRIHIGAAVTHTAIVRSPLIEQRATCLVESCGVVGGPQVRNVGTLGGNVAHALPAGDGTTSLVALDAEAEVAWSDGRREWLPIKQIFRGPGQSALDSTRDVLVGFRFRPCNDGEATAFKRIMRPQGVALPVLGCAVWIKLDANRAQFDDVRICIGPVDRIPARAVEAENALRGEPATEDSIATITEVARQSLHPRTSKYRATAEYRDYMIETLLRQALPLAVERARTGVITAEGVGLG